MPLGNDAHLLIQLFPHFGIHQILKRQRSPQLHLKPLFIDLLGAGD